LASWRLLYSEPEILANRRDQIAGNQAIKQQAERICRNEATTKQLTKACTHKSRNRSRTVKLATNVYDY